MKKFLKFLLYTFVSLIIAAGAILYAFTEVADAVVETIDDVHDINNYKTFVDDAVRYTLASANPKYIYMDSNLELQSKADRKCRQNQKFRTYQSQQSDLRDNARGSKS